jgi:hypothetical protein
VKKLLAVFAIIAVITTGVAAAVTHEFGLGGRHYTEQVVRTCNPMMRQAMLYRVIANSSGVLDGMTYLRMEGRLLHRMVAIGCPNGPYPLHNG